MSKSETIAAIAGPMLVAAGASVLLNRDAMLTLAGQVSNDFGLIFLTGIILLTVGVAIVRTHNLWVADWRVIVTLLGWLAVGSGAARTLFFPQLAAAAPGVVQSAPWLLTASAIMLAAGATLTFKGFRHPA